ncbi:MmcQ/YjbR family DNA-binding protein [Kribbella sancticallisti]|uniref:MmcQ/YjbR family DNA-binding protein n=1 Tax=Kribbella sancticallisti TaxID=460087 RepID=A0ABN2EIR8_9ACTN
MDAAAVRKLMLGLPGVEEREGWAGQPAYRVRKKGFAYLSEDETSVMFKALREEQEAMVAEDPEVYSAWWSAGRFGWLGVELATADEDELRELLIEAWRLTAPKYLVAQLDQNA